MLYVKLTQDQVNLIPQREKGYSSEKINGEKVNVIFCTLKAFRRYISIDQEVTFFEV